MFGVDDREITERYHELSVIHRVVTDIFKPFLSKSFGHMQSSEVCYVLSFCSTENQAILSEHDLTFFFPIFESFEQLLSHTIAVLLRLLLLTEPKTKK